MRRSALLSTLALLALASAARADGLDTSKPLSCALAKASQCDGVAQCSDVALADIDLPELVNVDFAGKQLASPDRQRTSPILVIEALDAVLLLQGNQNGRGWTMVVERATGHLAATITDVEGVFVLAGACTAQ